MDANHELVRAFEYLDQDEFSARTRRPEHAYPAVLDRERNTEVSMPGPRLRTVG